MSTALARLLLVQAQDSDDELHQLEQVLAEALARAEAG